MVDECYSKGTDWQLLAPDMSALIDIACKRILTLDEQELSVPQIHMRLSRKVRVIKSHGILEAMNRLSADGMGRVVKTNRTIWFVKQPPEIIRANPNLAKYNLLVRSGLDSKDHM
jgi:hypothetical protein